MKKLLKSVICGFVNSAHVHCSKWKVNICSYCSMNSNHIAPKRVKKKKKKKRGKRSKTDANAGSVESKHTHYMINLLLEK